MKKILIAFLFIMLAVSAAHAKSYYYKDYEVRVDINENGSFWVSEKMTFHFEGNFHYAYRDIEEKKLRYISDIQVIDEVTKKKVFVVPRHHANRIMVRWGFNLSDTDHTWTVKYLVHGAIGFFQDHDELWWNCVPSDRTVPIEKVRVYVTLPSAVYIEDQMKAEIQSYAADQQIEKKDYKTFVFSGSDVQPGGDFTIVAGWPKGIVNQVLSDADKESWFARPDRAIGMLAPLFMFIFMFQLWWRKGRDIKTDRDDVVVPAFKPPDSIRPAIAGTLIDEKADTRDIIAVIVDLAVRGYLKIIEEESPFIFGSRKRYAFKWLKEGGDLEDHEKLILIKLFSHGLGVMRENTLGYVTMDDLKDRFYKDIPKIKEALYSAVEEKGYFDESPDKTRSKYSGTAGCLIMGFVCFVMFLGGAISLIGFTAWHVFAVISSLIIIIVFGMKMPRRTEKGSRVTNELKGFKMYLYTAERFRLGVVSTETLQQTFEKYLPYAILFRVEKQWARRFADIELQSPDWYSGKSGSFYAASFGNSFSGMVSGMNTAMTSSPSSSSGFGGGGGGGGGG
ncbi:hypothetical protein COY52_10830, partial [Candidatus Desantisbacteria bacterium CG_4_10_14_0_8_um_filter_48_22]